MERNRSYNIPDFTGAKIITQNNFDVIDGGNTLMSPRWYNQQGSSFSSGHTMIARGASNGTGYGSSIINVSENTYTKLTTDFSSEPEVNIIIKF